MDLLDIAIAKQLAGGGGGSGTDNYNDLSNLPKINDVTLSGNKSSSALGLQSEITSENKLDSDLIDDTNQDNKFVTSTEKNTWNAKQNAIDADHKLNADYVDDSTSTNKFVTASDKEAWNAKQSAIDSEHKLSSSLVSFTTAEAAALASGIDNTKVAQISTNQTNILLVKDATEELVDDGAKNIVKLYDVSEFTNIPSSLTITKKSDGSLTLNGSVSSALYSRIGEVSGKATGYSMYVSTIVSDNTTIGYFYTSDNHLDSTGGVRKWHNYTSDWSANLFLYVAANSTLNNVTLYPMICLKSKYDISDEYQPPALPNYDLTRLEAEDRAALADVVDSGAKNVFTPTSAITGDAAITVVDNGDGSYNVTGGSNETIRKYVTFNIPTTGDYVLSGCPNTGSNDTYRLDLRSSGGTVLAVDYGSGSTPIHLTAGTGYQLSFRFNANYTAPTTGLTFKPMVCTQAEWKISQNYAPFALPNTDLTVLEAEDRAALVEVVDSGAKNLFNYSAWVGCTVSNGTGVFENNGITLTPTSNSICHTNFLNGVYPEYAKVFVNSGDKITLSWDYEYQSETGGSVHIYANGAVNQYEAYAPITAKQIDYTVPTGVTFLTFCMLIGENNQGKTVKFKDLMICTKADWKVSQNYAPHRKNLDQLEATKAPALSVAITSGDLNDVTINTFAMYANTVSSLPTSENYYVETSVFDVNSLLQRAYNIATAESYVRVKCVGSWSAWKQITNA